MNIFRLSRAYCGYTAGCWVLEPVADTLLIVIDRGIGRPGTTFSGRLIVGTRRTMLFLGLLRDTRLTNRSIVAWVSLFMFVHLTEVCDSLLANLFLAFRGASVVLEGSQAWAYSILGMTGVLKEATRTPG